MNCILAGKISSTTSLSYSGTSSTVWHVDRTALGEETFLTLTVKPSVDRTTGFIACFGQAGSDFLAVVADDGFVRVSMDLGAESPLTLTSIKRLNAGESTLVDVQRTGREVQLTVCDHQSVSGSYLPNFVQLDVGSQLYVGGAPSSLLSSQQKSTIGISSGFNGCIGNVTVNQQALGINNDLLSSFNVAECDLNLCSHLSPCQNGGTCSASGNSVVCQCSEKYQGVTCDQLFDPCSTVSCQSGSTCLQTGDVAVCLCPLGKSGKLCDEGNVASCKPMPHLLILLFPRFTCTNSKV